jgi:hypothetical protein
MVLVGLVYLLFGGRGSATQPPLVLAAAVPIPTPPPPLDVAAVQATADAIFTRTPGALIPATPTPPPPKPTAAPPKPGEPAKPPAEPPKPGAPVATATRAATPAPAQTPTPEPTEPPTRTPTVSPTPSVTPTSTATITPTPLPSPCDAKTTVPRLAPGSGYYVTFVHEVAGDITVTWPTVGGRILVYADRPAELGGGESGEYTGVPTAGTLTQGTGGGGLLNLPGREPGTYSVLFFNPTGTGIGPDDAVVHYWTYGHCP